MCQRNTMQRTMTLEAVLRLRNHPTADEVYDYIKEKYPHISRSTVYRNLNKLCDSGDIARVKISGLADRYDHRLSHHYHFICDCCKKLIDLDIPYIDSINQMCNDRQCRQVNAHQILFDGICTQCAQKSQQPQRHKAKAVKQ